MSAVRTFVCPLLPLARQLHYLKHTLVFICGADDVATSSTFPSPAVYIREPIWRYKTRQQEGGGSEPERRAVEAILQSGGLLANLVSCVVSYVKDVFGWFSCQCSVLTNMTDAVVSWVEWWFWDSYSASWSWNGGNLLSADKFRLHRFINFHRYIRALRTSTFLLNTLTFILPLLRHLRLTDNTNAFPPVLTISEASDTLQSQLTDKLFTF